MSEWQPIETAPRDGRDVLVFMDGDVFQAIFDRERWKFPYADYHGCGCCGGDADEPTHWMSLPEAPK